MIVSTYRPEAMQKYGGFHFTQSNHFGAVLKPTGKRTSPDLPTFWEFVQYIINTPVEFMEEHWAPQSYICSTCLVRYDTIVHFEKFNREIELFWSSIGISESVEESLWNSHTETLVETEAITNLYFSELSDAEIMRLYKVYKQDFDVFGYSFEIRKVKIVPNMKITN